jgi:hypothetical protein
MVIIKEMYRDNPPNKGFASRCNLRSPGWSTIPNLKAILLIIKVKNKELIEENVNI